MTAPSLHSPVAPSQALLKQWLQRHLDLLQRERDEEQAQSHLLLSRTPPKLLEQNGLALLGLGLVGIRIGLGAKLLVELERPSAYHATPLFPAHSFRTGDLAEIQDHTISTVAEASSSSSSSKSASKSSKTKNEGVQGVVYRVTDTRIVLAVSDRKSSKGSGGKNPSNPASAPAGPNGTDDKSNRRDVRSGDANKVGRDELEIPERVRLVKVANEATFDRMERTLAKLAKLLGVSVKTGHAGGSDHSDDGDEPGSDPAAQQTVSGSTSAATAATELVQTLVGLRKPTFASPVPELPLPPFNAHLNPSQLEAIRFAISAHHVALLHGPPGTGKTTAVVELILQLVLGDVGARDGKGVRILVCGASNLAVDNLLERLVGRPDHRDALRKKGAGVTRLGHPARVLASLQTATLDAQSAMSAEGQLVGDVATELSTALAALRPPSAAASTAGNKSTRPQARLKGAERRQRWEEVRQLRREYRQRERGVTRAILDRAQVVVATCHGAGGKQLQGREFDVVIIDEACQALEAACWIPILKVREGGKVVLAGDHLQLPPTVKSEVGKRERGGGPKNKGKKKAKARVPTKDGSSGNSSGGVAKGRKQQDKDGNIASAKPDAGTTSAPAETSDDDDDDDDNDDEPMPTFSASAAAASQPPKQPTLRPPRTLETTLFSRLLGLYGAGLKSLLSIQYRMNRTIMAFPNLALYESRLSAHPSCADISLRDLPHFQRTGGGGKDEAEAEEEVETAPVVFYDTAGCEMYETSEAASDGGGVRSKLSEGSKRNEHEVALVVRHLRLLVASGVATDQVTVLAPYSAQVSLLAASLREVRFVGPGGEGTGGVAGEGERVEVGTVDAMQGREKEVVVVSLVRSNERGEVGFLSERRRLNVAMTRAKRQLVVVGDSETVRSEGGFLARWMEWLEEFALVESVVTLQDV